jgi:hypothetical protein
MGLWTHALIQSIPARCDELWGSIGIRRGTAASMTAYGVSVSRELRMTTPTLLEEALLFDI